MKKKTHASGPTLSTIALKPSSAAKAVLLAGFLFIASALFLSQATPLFAKAASPNIRGTIVLADKNGFSWSGTMFRPMNVMAPVALPGSSCSVILSACGNTDNQNVYQPDIVFDGAVKATGSNIQLYSTPFASACVASPAFSTNGGLHSLESSNGGRTGYLYTTHLAIAYDCSP